ncbi:MAG: hypothetical protein E6G44_08440 [Actinobacteria bacterium]|nr:MAG: hypothetical protein E6G44_08440 [Actinomycetota bacterium]
MGAPVHPDGPPSRTDAAVPPDELRPVTALFADIVGSTSLGERLTPAEVKALIGECVSRMSRAVEEFGGIIQAYTGDGICAYFGVPVAHEDDPERAARAALRIINMAREYARDVEAAWGLADFNVRVGINTGPAGVGLVGGETPQALALGDATNVAARLESAAEPGTIAVGYSTARRLAMSFILESLGQIMVKGRDEPVAAWRLVGPQTETGEHREIPLVGREGEMALLASVVEDMAAGRGQILLIEGDAGIGKTRLLAELQVMAAGRCTWRRRHQDAAAGEAGGSPANSAGRCAAAARRAALDPYRSGCEDGRGLEQRLGCVECGARLSDVDRSRGGDGACCPRHRRPPLGRSLHAVDGRSSPGGHGSRAAFVGRRVPAGSNLGGVADSAQDHV